MAEMINADIIAFTQLVERAGGPQAAAKLLKVGKDWVYRRLSGETPIKEKDELLTAQRWSTNDRRSRGRRRKSA